MRHRTAITVGLGRELWLLTLVVMSCGVSGHAMDTNRPAAASARVPAVCAATGQRPGRRGVRRPAIIDPAAYRGPYSYVARDATIRLLAKAPLTYQVVDAGARASEPSEISSTADWTFAWGAPGATPQAVAALDQLAFGDIAHARFGSVRRCRAENRPGSGFSHQRHHGVRTTSLHSIREKFTTMTS